MNALEIDSAISLRDIEPGVSGRIKTMNMPEETVARLAGLGICEGLNVKIVKHGEPCIVRTYGSRVGIASSLVNQIHVDVATI
jgi:Fe2+ transport system protein FeoA